MGRHWSVSYLEGQVTLHKTKIDALEKALKLARQYVVVALGTAEFADDARASLAKIDAALADGQGESDVAT